MARLLRDSELHRLYSQCCVHVNEQQARAPAKQVIAPPMHSTSDSPGPYDTSLESLTKPRLKLQPASCLQVASSRCYAYTHAAGLGAGQKALHSSVHVSTSALQGSDVGLAVDEPHALRSQCAQRRACSGVRLN